MASTDISDSVNFDLLYQTIPGTYNKYDRITIREDLNLQFPPKIGINNWSDQVRWKTFMIHPPRPRGVMIEDTEEIEAARLERLGVKTDIGLPSSIKNLDKFKFAIKKYSFDGVDMKETEELTLPEIMGDLEPLRRVARLQNLFSVIKGDQTINLQPSIIQGVANQQVLLGVIGEAIADLGTTREAESKRRLQAMLDKGPQLTQEEAKEMLQTKLLYNFSDFSTNNTLHQRVVNLFKAVEGKTTIPYNEFVVMWNKYKEVELDLSQSAQTLIDALEIEAQELEEEAKEEKTATIELKTAKGFSIDNQWKDVNNTPIKIPANGEYFDRGWYQTHLKSRLLKFGPKTFKRIVKEFLIKPKHNVSWYSFISTSDRSRTAFIKASGVVDGIRDESYRIKKFSKNNYRLENMRGGSMGISKLLAEQHVKQQIEG